jgi:hypothetical protein
MSMMIIRLTEVHEDLEGNGNMAIVDIGYQFEDLQVGDVLPGLAPLILRRIGETLDVSLGKAVTLTPDTDAFIN